MRASDKRNFPHKPGDQSYIYLSLQYLLNKKVGGIRRPPLYSTRHTPIGCTNQTSTDSPLLFVDAAIKTEIVHPTDCNKRVVFGIYRLPLIAIFEVIASTHLPTNPLTNPLTKPASAVLARWFLFKNVVLVCERHQKARHQVRQDARGDTSSPLGWSVRDVLLDQQHLSSNSSHVAASAFHSSTTSLTTAATTTRQHHRAVVVIIIVPGPSSLGMDTVLE